MRLRENVAYDGLLRTPLRYFPDRLLGRLRSVVMKIDFDRYVMSSVQ